MIITTPIFITDEEAKKFLLFQKYYDVFKKLDDANVFDVQFGKCTFNIAFGQIQNIVKEEIVFHREKE